VKLDRERFRLALAAGELVRLDAAQGVEVACESGRLWITEEAQPRDVWLSAGESVRLQGRGVAVLEALRAGVFSLSRHLTPSRRA
jgi:hypothetical protein